MTRMERFEKIWAAQHAVPPESLLQYRWVTQEGYRLPAMAAHFRTFCETLDSIVIELPKPETPESYEVFEKDDPEEYARLERRAGAQYSAIFKCQQAIEAVGLKVAS